MVAELWEASGRRGGAGGRGGSGRRRRAPLGGCVRETEEGGRSEESERGSQGLRGDARRAVASRWKQEVAGEAGGGRGSVGARRPRALPTGAGKTTGEEWRWAGPEVLGRPGGFGERQVSPDKFLLFFCFCFLYFATVFK